MKQYPWTLPTILAAATLGLTLYACTMTGHVEGDSRIDTPVGPVDVGLKVDVGQRKLKANNSTGKCFKATFKDAAGNVTGTATVGSESEVELDIPEGSKKFKLESTDCSHLRQVTGGMHQITWDRARDFIVLGGPLEFEDNSTTGNAVYSFVVHAHNEDEAGAIADSLLLQPIGTPIDPRVTIWTFQRMEPGAFSTHFVAIGKQQFLAWQMDLNGQTAYAALGAGATQVQIGSNVWIVETDVPHTAFNGNGVLNDGLISWQNAGQSAHQSPFHLLYD